MGWESRLIAMNVEGQPVAVMGDEITTGLVNIPTVHHEIHEAHTFQCSYKSPEGSDIADDGVLDILIITNNRRWPHFVFTAAAGGDAELFFYEDVTYTDIGIPCEERNMKRTGNDNSNLQIYHTPVVVVNRLLRNVFLAGGAGNPAASKPGGTERNDTEWILKKSSNYFLRMYNRSGGAIPMGLSMQWYGEISN